MRVHKPKVEYKLALQEKPKGAPWRIIIYNYFEKVLATNPKGIVGGFKFTVP